MVETKQLLEKYNLVADRNYDQFFLIDDQVIDIIANQIEYQKESHLCEIGTGLGNLTVKLVERFDSITSIEIDTRLKKIIDYRFKKIKNVKFVFEDFLIHNNDDYDYIIGNIPFTLTEKIIRKLISMNFKEGIIMVSTNFRDIFFKKKYDKRYALIRVIAKLFYKIEILVDNIPKDSFFPQANVGAAVLKITSNNFDTYEEIMMKRLFLNQNLKLVDFFSQYQYDMTISNDLKEKVINQLTISDLITIEPFLKVIFKYT